MWDTGQGADRGRRDAKRRLVSASLWPCPAPAERSVSCLRLKLHFLLFPWGERTPCSARARVHGGLTVSTRNSTTRRRGLCVRGASTSTGPLRDRHRPPRGAAPAVARVAAAPPAEPWRWAPVASRRLFAAALVLGTAAFHRPAVTPATAPSAEPGAWARRQDGERRRGRGGWGGGERGVATTPGGGSLAEASPALTWPRSALCPDALPGQAGRGGYPAAGRQAEEEREESAAAGRAPGLEGLHRRDRIAGGNGRGGAGGGETPSRGRRRRLGSAAPLGRAVLSLPRRVPNGAAGPVSPSPALCPPRLLPAPS